MSDVVAKGGTTLYLGPEYVTAFLDAKGTRMSATLDAKDPLESKNYYIDTTFWMQALGTQASGFGSPSVSPAEVTADATQQGNIFRILVAGGAHGTIAKVVLPFSTSDGQDLVATIHIPIKDK